MITAKYLRFKNFETASTFAYVDLGGLKLYSGTTVVLSDTVKTGVIFADTAHYPNFDASKITSTSSAFAATKTDNPVVTITFPTPISFDSYDVKLFISTVNSVATTGFVMEASDDGVTYTQIAYKTGITSTNNQIHNFTIDAATTTTTQTSTTNTTTTPPPTTTTTSTTSTTNQTTNTTTTTPDAQAAADKLTVTSLKNRAKAGDTLIDDEAIMMKVGDSVLVTQIMAALDGGGNYDTLRALGLSESMSVDVLGIYNTKPDTTRYEREAGIDAIIQTKARLKDFLGYLDTHSIAYPNLNSLFSSIRSNMAVYEALRQWNKTRTV